MWLPHVRRLVVALPLGELAVDGVPRLGADEAAVATCAGDEEDEERAASGRHVEVG